MTGSSPRTTHHAPRTSVAPRTLSRTWLLAWLAATLLLLVAFRAAGWSRVVGIGARIHPAWLVMAVCGNLAIQPFAAMQWRLLLPPDRRIRLRKMLPITALISLALNTAPALLGHASTVMILGRQPGIGHGTALSVLALDQLTEAIAKLTIVLLAILLLPVPAWMQTAAIVLACLVAVFLAAMVVAARNYDVVARWAEGSNHRSMSAFVARWTHRLETLRTPRHFLLALLACLGMKLVEGLAILATQHAVGVSLPPSSGLLILAAAGFGTIFPLAPGNLGTYEASVFLAYRWLGVSSADAIALAVVQHLAYLAAATGTGYVVLSLKQVRGWSREGRVREEGR
jgi:glycosyltransferase 2 family protein